MKGTIIIGCRGLWNYTKKPSKKCILLDEKLFGGREDGEYLDGETYIRLRCREYCAPASTQGVSPQAQGVPPAR